MTGAAMGRWTARNPGRLADNPMQDGGDQVRHRHIAATEVRPLGFRRVARVGWRQRLLWTPAA
jgi:hypothetical protein